MVRCHFKAGVIHSVSFENAAAFVAVFNQFFWAKVDLKGYRKDLMYTSLSCRIHFWLCLKTLHQDCSVVFLKKKKAMCEIILKSTAKYWKVYIHCIFGLLWHLLPFSKHSVLWVWCFLCSFFAGFSKGLENCYDSSVCVKVPVMGIGWGLKCCSSAPLVLACCVNQTLL